MATQRRRSPAQIRAAHARLSRALAQFGAAEQAERDRPLTVQEALERDHLVGLADWVYRGVVNDLLRWAAPDGVLPHTPSIGEWLSGRSRDQEQLDERAAFRQQAQLRLDELLDTDLSADDPLTFVDWASDEPVPVREHVREVEQLFRDMRASDVLGSWRPSAGATLVRARPKAHNEEVRLAIRLAGDVLSALGSETGTTSQAAIRLARLVYGDTRSTAIARISAWLQKWEQDVVAQQQRAVGEWRPTETVPEDYYALNWRRR